MTDAEPRGCLTALLNLFGVRFPGPSTKPRLSYRTRDDFLSPAELSFYRVLTSALGGSYVVCPKVNLADLFFVPRSPASRSFMNRIDRKHVDFVLCDPATMKPIAGIELDDASHGRPDRRERDRFVADVFEAAGLPLPRVPVSVGYSPEKLRELVRQAIDGKAITAAPAVRSEGDLTCPRCGSPMVRRTATKGGRKGEQFWGCGSYPRCREVMPT